VLIESKSRCTITDFFANFGEDEFRRVEADVVSQAMRGEKQVVATGGGAILLSANRQELWERGFVVYLMTTPEALVARLTNQGADQRPLLQGDLRDRLTSLLQDRSEYYEQAHVVIATDGALPETVAEMILKAYEHSS
jgi:shikimate kinase